MLASTVSRRLGNPGPIDWLQWAIAGKGDQETHLPSGSTCA